MFTCWPITNRSARRTVSVAALGAVFILSLFSSWWQVEAGSAVAPAEFGNHFILLIDDSGDMKSYKDILQTSLPELLFAGRVDGQTVDASFPRFQPGRDQVSVVFFTIYNGSDIRGCAGTQRGSSALPADMFVLETVDSATRGGFAGSLEMQLLKSCRFAGGLSPIATAPSLILPYLQEKLPRGQLFSRTIIVEATNELVNTDASPALELGTFQQRFNVAGTEQAVGTSHQVAASFRFNTPPNWNRTTGSLHLNVFEVLPLNSVDIALSYQPKIQLDRQAVSKDRLQLVPEVPHTGDLHIKLDPAPAYRFRPLSLQLSFQDAKGGAWKLGERTTPADMSIALTPCQPPACVDEGHRISVPMFANAGETLYVSREDPELPAGKINFTVGFSYEPGSYDHLFVKSSEQQIEVTPTKPLVVSGAFGILPSIKLDNRELAGLWRSDADGVTTQAEANGRLQARHNWYWAFFVLLVVALVATLIFYLYRTRYQRPFRPRLEWKPASEVVVDFNRPAASRVLVGKVKVVNETPVPWFGRLWHNEEQPTRAAAFSLSYDFFKESGLEVTSEVPVGFIQVKQDSSGEDQLGLATTEAVSDGKTVFLFFATDSLADYRQRLTNGNHAVDQSFKIDLLVKMEWGQNGAADNGQEPLAKKLQALLKENDHDVVFHELQCGLTIKPEQERKPMVTYVASPEPKLVFKEGREVQVGTFIFESQADHLFASPFVWGDYALQVYRGNKSLGGEPIRLAQPRLKLSPKTTTEVPVMLSCDGGVITNPDPVSDVYTFSLIGNFDPASEVSRQTTTIFRDDARAEIVLKLVHPEPAREIYWKPDGSVEQRLVDSSGAGELSLEGNTLLLEPQNFEFDATDHGPYDLLKLEVGNSASSGNGFVDVQLTTVVRDEEVSGAIHLSDGRPVSSLLDVLDFDHRSSHIRIAEGEKDESRLVRFSPGFISGIDGAVVPSDQLKAEVRLAIHVHTDQGEDIRRELCIAIPLGLELRPNPNWLCIDYGTSAIAAAFGSGEEEHIVPIRLQEIRGNDNHSFATLDPHNMEEKNPFLLPSWIICDADIRETDENTNVFKNTRPGFPGYVPPSLKPGDAAFISLPAANYQFARAPGRIIYSIKSWLGQSSPNVSLDTPIRHERDDHTVVSSNVLPLDKMVESSFAALSDGYLLAKGENYRADQLIICYPNTFTRNHQQNLREIAFRALSRRFGIQRPERVHLISESDAVAYYYCHMQMKENRCAGTERLLVYDFGAGTLDLSLIRIEWNKDPYCYPARWKVEGRTGVPVAGNYLDEILARLIDRLLRELITLQREPLLKYFYRVVAKSKQPGKEYQHRAAILTLWQKLREAKHKWNGRDPFVVEVGSLADEDAGVVRCLANIAEREALTKTPPPADEAGVWVSNNYLYLSIPAAVINGDDQMKEFQTFVTETVIDELLQAAEIPANEVNTVVISGRGALWPGLRGRVKARFPGAEHPDLLRDATMKSAVVQGAIARQNLNIDFEEAEDESTFKPKLGVLINNNQDIVTEDDWGKPIDLSRSPTFRIVQINMKEPNPREDSKSLRRHFYIDVDSVVYRRGSNLINVVRGEERNGKFMLQIREGNGRLRSHVLDKAASQVVTSAPWPVGSFLLTPDEKDPAGE